MSTYYQKKKEKLVNRVKEYYKNYRERLQEHAKNKYRKLSKK